VILPLVLAISQVAQVADFRKPIETLLETPWPKNRTFTIVCHGHSVPAGYFKTPVVQTFDAYPHLLHEAIKQHFPSAVVNVIVTAIGGENSEQGAARFKQDVLSLKPDVVTIDYALNDRGIGLDRARIAWEKMILLSKASGVKVILLTPSWDLSAKPEDAKDPLNQQAQQVRELASKFQTGLADSFAEFLKASKSGAKMETLMSQVNHPNRAGHELILKGLAPWFIP
jgi:acyl-CoA thioesterase-1